MKNEFRYKLDLYPETVIRIAIQAYQSICTIAYRIEEDYAICTFFYNGEEIEQIILEFSNYLIELMESRSVDD